MSVTAADTFQLRYLGDAVLTTPCELVGALSEIPDGLISAMRDVCAGRLRSLADSRVGLGLAANQVGGLVRVILVRVASEQTMRVMINPVLSRRSASKTHGPEGCLSIPGFQTNIPRHNWATVHYHDEQWNPQSLEVTGLTARCVQHEVDHLDGRLIVDGLSRQLRRQAERAVEKARGLA
jgi:peptide deformylase